MAVSNWSFRLVLPQRSPLSRKDLSLFWAIKATKVRTFGFLRLRTIIRRHPYYRSIDRKNFLLSPFLDPDFFVRVLPPVRWTLINAQDRLELTFSFSPSCCCNQRTKMTTLTTSILLWFVKNQQMLWKFDPQVFELIAFSLSAYYGWQLIYGRLASSDHRWAVFLEVSSTLTGGKGLFPSATGRRDSRSSWSITLSLFLIVFSSHLAATATTS